MQGVAVSMSADGMTCVSGGNGDDFAVGATWVFKLKGDVWTQVGDKLIGSGYAGNVGQGYSLALSADAGTLIVGSVIEGVANPPVWVFVDDDGWQQQGSYLQASDSVPDQSAQNTALAVSADGNTFVLGEDQDNAQAGAAWIFVRKSGVWSQQGGKLVGTDATGQAGQGCSVSISSKGDSIAVGGQSDNGNLENGWVGAVWVYQLNNNHWYQISNKLVGKKAIGNASQGSSVSLSGNGMTVIWGGYNDDGGIGAAWAFNKVYTPT